LARKKAAPAPTTPPQGLEDAVRVLKQDALNEFSTRNQMMRDMRTRVYQEKAVPIPRAYKGTTREVRLPLMHDTVRLMVAICDGAEPRVKVDPYDSTVTAKRNSSRRERWSEAMLDQVENELGRKVRSMARENQMIDGLAVLKVVERRDHWADLPEAKTIFGRDVEDLKEDEASSVPDQIERAKRGAKLPFTIIDVDPMSFYPGYGPDGELDYALEVQERQILPVMQQYADKLRLTKKGSTVSLAAIGEGRPYDEYATTTTRSTVQVWTYTDREWTMTFVEHVLVKSSRHATGVVPYFHCYQQPSSSRDPQRRTRPTLYKTTWIADLLDSFFTMMTNAGYLYLYPTPVLETPANVQVPLGADGRPVATKYEAGKQMVLFPGQKFQFITPPLENLKGMNDLIDKAMRMFEVSSGLGPTVKGLAGSDASGYQVNQLIQASLLGLQPSIDAFDWMLEQVIAYVWRLIAKRIEQKVWVMGTATETKKDPEWLSLGPDDIDGYYRVRVRSKPLVVQQRIAQGSFAADMVNAKLISRRRAIEEFLNYENEAEDILDEIYVDEIMEGQPFKDMTTFQALKNAGIPLPPSVEEAMGGKTPPGPPPAPGMQGAGVGAPGLGPLGPGLGAPLQPGPPPAPPMTADMMQAAGGLAAPGRPAGVERQPPTQSNPSIYP
jgi:hypothetical protein